MPQLRRLNVTETSITDEQLGRIYNNCKNLENQKGALMEEIISEEPEIYERATSEEQEPMIYVVVRAGDL